MSRTAPVGAPLLVDHLRTAPVGAPLLVAHLRTAPVGARRVVLSHRRGDNLDPMRILGTLPLVLAASACSGPRADGMRVEDLQDNPGEQGRRRGPRLHLRRVETFTPASGAPTTTTAYLQSYDAATGKITFTK